MAAAKAKRALSPQEPEKQKRWKISTLLSAALAVLGAVGGIELRPQISISPQEQLATNDPFSSPFDITNSGYLSIHVENVTVVWPRIEFENGTTFEWASTNDVTWDNFDLDRAESKTIAPHFSNAVPKNADTLIAIDYKFLGMKWRRLFRFEGIHLDRWQWSKQPIGDMKAEAKKQVDYSLAQHRKDIERQH